MTMAKRKRDPIREDRIENEVIVDAYGPEEQAMGWHCYLEGKIRFPFQAKCIAAKVVSPLLKRRNRRSPSHGPRRSLRQRHARAHQMARPDHGGPLVSTASHQGEQGNQRSHLGLALLGSPGLLFLTHRGIGVLTYASLPKAHDSRRGSRSPVPRECSPMRAMSRMCLGNTSGKLRSDAGALLASAERNPSGIGRERADDETPSLVCDLVGSGEARQPFLPPSRYPVPATILSARLVHALDSALNLSLEGQEASGGWALLREAFHLLNQIPAHSVLIWLFLSA